MTDDPVHFVANYPPFDAWDHAALPAVREMIARPPETAAPLGAYVHIPFCRQRCRFCYFKVQTGTPASEVRDYVDSLLAEAALWSDQPVVRGRPLAYLYVGGGTPSYLSAPMITTLLDGLRHHLPTTQGAEITFECEPGTVRPHKMAALAEAGITRVSLGVESWNDALLSLNGRAHTTHDIEPAYRAARDASIPQINIDLIAGMIGETEASWHAGVQRTLDLQPDSVTIYQLDILPNTAIARAQRDGTDLGGPVADRPTRRRWAAEAFQTLRAHGYRLTSAYTAVRDDLPTEGLFVYRDALWHGADMVPLGVSSFGHLQGHHLQNHKRIGPWRDRIAQGTLALDRGHRLTQEERLTRQVVLQLKLGRLSLAELRTRFDPALIQRFDRPFAALAEQGLADVEPDTVRLTWEGLHQVDALLPTLFAERYRQNL